MKSCDQFVALLPKESRLYYEWIGARLWVDVITTIAVASVVIMMAVFGAISSSC